MKKDRKFTRRHLLAGSALALAAPQLARAQSVLEGSTEIERDITTSTRRNISSFRTLEWQPYFDNTRGGAILVDITSRALHFWSEDESIYRLYPTSVPLTEDLTRRGRTQVVLRDPNPDWRPTPAMQERNPEWPDYIPPGPGQSARHARAASELAVLPHPRNP